MKEEAINLRASKEGYVVDSVGWEGKGEMI